MKTIDTFQDILTVKYIDAAYISISQEEMIEKEIKKADSFLMILVQSGHADISLEHKSYRVTPDRLAFIIPNHIVQFNEISYDFKARLLLIDKVFLEEVIHEKKGFYNYISFKRDPFTPLEAEENTALEKAIWLLQEKIRNRTHIFQKEIVYNATEGLVLELLSIMVRKTNDMVHPVLSRKEEIVDEFLKLLSKHTRERRPLTFYAEKLFITPQYLSFILKEQTGKTGSKWINDALIVEAKRLIKSPHATVQGVAYTLNFSDQSTFGKFFKKSIGLSPLVYRRQEA